MKGFWIFFTLFSTMIIPGQLVYGQKSDKYQQKLQKIRQEEWPPERAYSRISLGYALQKTFRKHCEYCGFTVANEKRDYIPQDISRFLGKKDLRTKVETADIQGGGLLNYIFSGEELSKSLEEITYTPGRIFQLQSLQNQFLINPNDHFDSFFLHKTCNGFLKAALDAGMEPPYAVFKTAIETDSKRESSVLAVSGSFVSPLKSVLEANDYRTTEAMLQLWTFYQQNPQFVHNAYYLREFEGVMIKHIASAEENFQIELEGGLNLTGPIPAHLKTSLNKGKGGFSSFQGSDWETIVYTDFANPYDKIQLFASLPTPAQIQQYLSSLHPTLLLSTDLPMMIEGVEHQHHLVLSGIPEQMCANFWLLDRLQPGVYEGSVRLEAQPFFDEENQCQSCRFTVSGKPLSTNFRGANDARNEKFRLSYQLRSKSSAGGQYLLLDVSEDLQTSAHPIARASEGHFDLTKKDGWNFAFVWKMAIEVEDHYNPVNFELNPLINNLLVRRNDKALDMKITQIQADPYRKTFYVTLESTETFPLEAIDHANLQSYNLNMDVFLESKASKAVNIRSVKDVIRLPAIKVLEPVEAPVLESGGSE
ncbi:MAG TPA: hypothetical protein PKA00_11205 [Saprospiraceae bacterium]|nr:hypothetical protein [Saprospiraceae bacterium]HMQ83469.1 hypothetical protein [Saprospiraceae bacterium]